MNFLGFLASTTASVDTQSPDYSSPRQNWLEDFCTRSQNATSNTSLASLGQNQKNSVSELLSSWKCSTSYFFLRRLAASAVRAQTAQPLAPSRPASQPPKRPASQTPSRPAAQAPSRPAAHSLFSASAQGEINQFFLRRLAESRWRLSSKSQPPSSPASQLPKACSLLARPLNHFFL